MIEMLIPAFISEAVALFITYFVIDYLIQKRISQPLQNKKLARDLVIRGSKWFFGDDDERYKRTYSIDVVAQDYVEFFQSTRDVWSGDGILKMLHNYDRSRNSTTTLDKDVEPVELSHEELRDWWRAKLDDTSWEQVLATFLGLNWNEFWGQFEENLARALLRTDELRRRYLAAVAAFELIEQEVSSLVSGGDLRIRECATTFLRSFKTMINEWQQFMEAMQWFKSFDDKVRRDIASVQRLVEGAYSPDFDDDIKWIEQMARALEELHREMLSTSVDDIELKNALLNIKTITQKVINTRNTRLNIQPAHSDLPLGDRQITRQQNATIASRIRQFIKSRFTRAASFDPYEELRKLNTGRWDDIIRLRANSNSLMSYETSQTFVHNDAVEQQLL